MFVLCPHCQFLVALDPATGRAPAECPRCGKPLAPPVAGAAATSAAASQAAPEQDGQALPVAAGPDVPAPVASENTTPPETVPAPVAENARPRRGRVTKSRTAAVMVPPPPTDAGGEASAAAPADIGALAEAAIPEAARTEDTPAVEVAREAKAPEAAPDAGAEGTPPTAITDAEPAQASDPVVSMPPRSRHLPSFAHPLHAPSTRHGGRTIAAIAGLALLLALQLLLADRARLAGDARWRPLLSTLCGVLQCELPAWREPAAFTLVARDVRPARQGVLHVTATFRNDARWPQPWPALRLALQDVDGRTVGARTLRPEEYRQGGDDDARITQSGLASGQSARVAFDIAEPAATVVAFTFDFR